MKANSIDECSPDEAMKGIKLAQKLSRLAEDTEHLSLSIIKYEGDGNVVLVKQTSDDPDEVDAFNRFVYNNDGNIQNVGATHSANVFRWASFKP